MTTFKDVFGPKLGLFMEQYWPFVFLGCSVIVLLYRVGIWKIIYKLVKQVMIMTVMMICVIIWWVLVSQHIDILFQQFDTTAILSGIFFISFYVLFCIQ